MKKKKEAKPFTKKDCLFHKRLFIYLIILAFSFLIIASILQDFMGRNYICSIIGFLFFPTTILNLIIYFKNYSKIAEYEANSVGIVLDSSNCSKIDNVTYDDIMLSLKNNNINKNNENYYHIIDNNFIKINTHYYLQIYHAFDNENINNIVKKNIHEYKNCGYDDYIRCYVLLIVKEKLRNDDLYNLIHNTANVDSVTFTLMKIPMDEQYVVTIFEKDLNTFYYVDYIDMEKSIYSDGIKMIKNLLKSNRNTI